MNLGDVSISTFIALGLGALLGIAVPVIVALLWKFKKNESILTILVGAATFLIFAVLLEKPIQNVLLFPTQLGLSQHAVSSFLNSKPVLLALFAGLFPGIFEETGRLVAFKTVLRKKTNRETSISYGIGHGGFEVMYLMGISYIGYFVYAIMIKTGTFQQLLDQLIQQSPEQTKLFYIQVTQIAQYSFADLGVVVIERIIAVLFHIGASILVFYACRDKKRFWLYPVAVVLHTAMNFIAALCIFKIVEFPLWLLEVLVGIFSVLVFCGAYFLLYRKDKIRNETNQ